MGIFAAGIDTSKWQASKVDYAKARANGYTFAYLRIGCGNTKDKCFEKDYASAKAAGLKVGVYFYTYATTISEAHYDATRVLGWLGGRKLDLPIAYDIEDAKQKKNSKANNSRIYNEFSRTVTAGTGYGCCLYTGEYFYNTYFDLKTLMDCPLWIAKYSTKLPSVGKEIYMWQYSSDAISTPFYNGKLDRNYMMVETSAGLPLPGNPYPVPTRTLKKGSKGNDVKWVQNAVGVKADGIFGNDTKKAVINYQIRHLLKADGIVGPATLRVMKGA